MKMIFNPPKHYAYVIKHIMISVYCFLIIGLVCYMKPEIVGFEKSQLVSLKSKLKSYLKNIF